MNGDACAMLLLRDIDRSAAVQAYMQRTCDELAGALCGVSAPWQAATSASAAESGALAPEDVPGALRGGNLRERCGIFYRLLHAEGERRVLGELLRLALRGAACARALDAAQLRRAAAAPSSAPWDAPGAEAYRVLRAAAAARAHALPLRCAFPPLSVRELRVHGAREPVLHWTTGRMRWEILPASAFARRALGARERLVAGPSGHAHALMRVMRIFRSFRLDMWLLISIVWLVGADHHSIHEVAAAALSLGLHAPPRVSSVRLARLVLERVDAEDALQWG